jgi:hypothetical protein
MVVFDTVSFPFRLLYIPNLFSHATLPREQCMYVSPVLWYRVMCVNATFVAVRNVLPKTPERFIHFMVYSLLFFLVGHDHTCPTRSGVELGEGN